MRTVQMEFLRPGEIIAERDRCPIVYLPVGPLEWHGPAMPYGTDPLCAQAVARAAAQVTGGVNICSSYGGIEIPVVATDKKGDIIVFKIDAPAEEEDDVVNLDIAPVIHKGEVLIPAEIEAEKDTSGLF